MKIGYKLILGYVLVAVLASLTTFIALLSYRNIGERFESLMQDPRMRINVLSDLRRAGNFITSSTSEINVIYGESTALRGEVPQAALDKEEQQLVTSGYVLYDESINKLRNLPDAANSSQAELSEAIEKNGDELVKISSQIVAMKKKGVTGEEILKKREEFEKSEIAYLQALDTAVLYEHKLFSDEQLNVQKTILYSRNTTILITFLTFVLAIILGFYLSHLISRRIIKLKEASEAVGRGQLETHIEIRNNDEIGDLARAFNKMIEDLKKSRNDLASAKLFSDKMLESMVDFVIVTDLDLTIRQVNKAALKLNGYEEHELIGKSGNILSADTSFGKKDIDLLRKMGHIGNLDGLNLNKDGSLTPISMSASVLRDDEGNDIGIVCVGKDVSGQKRQEAERQAITEIIQSVITTSDLDELFKMAHRAISKILYAENCFIALYNPGTNLLHFDYWVDKVDPTPLPFAIGKGFTSYIMQTGQSLLLTEELEEQLYARGLVEKGTGSDSASWMGVPLCVGSQTIGVLAVQHYEKSDVYSQRDLELLASVGSQFALAINRKQTELQLISSERQLNDAQRLSNIGSWQWEALTNKMSWSDECCRVYGFEPQKIDSSIEAFLSYIHPEEQKFVQSIIEDAVNGESFANLEHRIVRPDGSVRNIVCNGEAILDKNGRIVKLVGTTQDITERKQVEKELSSLHLEVKNQNERLNNIIKNLPGVVWESFAEQDGQTPNVSFVSEQITGLTGYSVDEWLSTPNFWLTILHPEDREKIEQEAYKQYSEGKSSIIEYRLITKDGRTIWVESRAEIAFDNENRPIGMRGVTLDITQRKQSERELQQLNLQIENQRHRLNDILDNSPSVIWDVPLDSNDKDALPVFANNYVTTLLGYSPEEWGSRPDFWLSAVHPDDREAITRNTEQLFKEGRGSNQSRWITKEGREIWCVTQMNVVKNKTGKPIGLRGVTTDITERKQLEQEVEAQRNFLRGIIDTNPNLIFVKDWDGRFILANRRFAEAYSTTVEELIGKTDADINPNDAEVQLFLENDREVLTSGKTKFIPEESVTSSTGELHWVEIIKLPITAPDGESKLLLGVATDITERKKNLEALRASEEQHRLLFETNPQPAYVYDLETLKFLAVNEAAIRHYGFSREEFLKDITLEDIRPSKDIPLLYEKLSKVVPGKDSILSPSRHKKKDGTVIDVEITSHVLQFAGKRAEIVLVNDVTERKKADEKLRVFNEKLQQSNRELQDFAYVASHDLQEPLRKVQAFGDRLKQKYADKLEDTGLDYLERMRNAAQRMQKLIQDLLTFSRVATKVQPFVPVDLEKITREVLSDLEVKIEETGALVELENLPEIDADPSQMRQLVQNLIGNALKFSHAEVAPIVRISAQAVENHSNNPGNGTNGRYCQINVKDNGIGFDEKYLDKIFTVFQRLHGRTEYEGAGVGLAVCRKIVERHHGTITAKSAPGEGATFIITFPFNQPKTETN